QDSGEEDSTGSEEDEDSGEEESPQDQGPSGVQDSSRSQPQDSSEEEDSGGQDSGESSEAQGSPEGSGDEDSGEEESPQGQGPSGGEDSDEEDFPESQSSPGGQASSGGAPDQELIEKLLEEQPQIQDLGTLAATALDLEAGQANRGTGGLPPLTALPEVPPLSGGVSLIEEAKMKASGMRHRLLGLLQAKRLVHRRPSRRGRRIDPRRLWEVGARLPDPRPFLHKEEKEGISTAVVVLLDASSSMNNRVGGSKAIVVATEAVLAIALALESIRGVEVATASFGSAPTFPGGCIRPLTRFGESVAKTATRYAPLAEGGTPTADAVMWAAWQLLGRREPRKLIIAVTDGVPNSQDLLEEAVKAVSAMGIDSAEIRIGEGGDPCPFPRRTVIKSARELGGALKDLLVEKI
ncbi:MAG: VWA domain-containing protein, partial [Gammaproteobacteria bacterium]